MDNTLDEGVIKFSCEWDSAPIKVNWNHKEIIDIRNILFQNT